MFSMLGEWLRVKTDEKEAKGPVSATSTTNVTAMMLIDDCTTLSDDMTGRTVSVSL